MQKPDVGGGINEWQPCQWLLERGDFDLFLLAGRYLERRARERTAAATAQLVNLLPASCLRLDADGNSQTFDVVAAGCDANNTEIVNAWDDGNDVNVVVSSTDAGLYDLALMDASGKTLVVPA